MTEPELPSSAASPVAPPAAAPSPAASDGKRPARLWPLTVLVVAGLVATAAGGYWLWQQQQQQLATLSAALEVAQKGINQRSVDLQKLELALAQEKGRASEAAAQLERTQASQAEAIAALKLPQQQRWQLTEVAYLARLANRRLWYEQDVASAIALLSDADRLLAGVEGARVMDVRAALASDLATLRAVPLPDFDGARMRLAGLQQQVDNWRLPSTELRAPAPVADERSDWQRSWQQLAGEFFTIHRDQEAAPLLLPDQALWLRENMRLALQRAQLALQMREQSLYQAAIGDLQLWLKRYFDPRAPEVIAAAAELDLLSSLQLRLVLPENLAVSQVLAASPAVEQQP